MTTIAYRDGIMACDSGCYEGDVKTCSVKKLYKFRGALIGISGKIRDCLRFVDWIRSGAHPDDVPRGEYTCIVVSRGGAATCYENGGLGIEIHGKYFAIGVGQEIALGALHAGADARMAIRAAIEHCSQTDGPVRSIRL